MLLVGDLGGTKMNLAVIADPDGMRSPLAEATLPSGDYPDLESLLAVFLREVNLPIDRAVFGVAGPVLEGRANITNLPWEIEEQRIAKMLGGARVRLLNDLTAAAHGIPLLGPDELYTLNVGDPVYHGALGVVAPGTGLGEGYLTWDGSRYAPQPSEGGHASFAPINAQQVDMLAFLLQRYGHISVERVCSGSGLPNIYDYLKASGYAPEPDWLAAELAGAEDRTPAIVRGATECPGRCELCCETVRVFVSILGAETGNLALKVMATGGVYLAGGIPPRILSFLTDGAFMEAFCNKGRMSDLLERIPVHVVLNPKTALIGAAAYGFDLLGA